MLVRLDVVLLRGDRMPHQLRVLLLVELLVERGRLRRQLGLESRHLLLELVRVP